VALQNIFLFSQALVAKLIWRLITSDKIWTSVIKQKYIYSSTLLDWIRSPLKKSANCSLTWKATLKSFFVVGDGLAWRIGDGTKVCIGVDPWLGNNVLHILLPKLIKSLHDQGFFHLNQVTDPL
jgi:hypothetical protein